MLNISLDNNAKLCQSLGTNIPPRRQCHVLGSAALVSSVFCLRVAPIEVRCMPIVATQVRSLACAIPPPEPSFMEEEACTDVLSLVQRCASSMDGTISQGGGISLDPGASPLVSPEVESC